MYLRTEGVVRFDEDNNDIHLATTAGILVIQLDSMQFTKLSHDYIYM
jgi:hypothetical protein